jgi:hypothetical protein
MEDESAHLLTKFLPSSWIIRPIAKDYGVDYEIELVEEDVVSGNRIWVQLKSIKAANLRVEKFELNNEHRYLATEKDRTLSVEYLSFSLPTKELHYSLSCAFPLLLFVADLKQSEIYWLPLRDEILGNTNHKNPNWNFKKSNTLRIPIWNKLSWEKKNNYPGIKWYALEPSRMYAFANLHCYYHNFKQAEGLSGYKLGVKYDSGKKSALASNLELACKYISAALALDVLFGKQGIDAYRGIILPNAKFMGIQSKLEEALKSGKALIKNLNRRNFSYEESWFQIMEVKFAIDCFSEAISIYEGFQLRHLLTHQTAFWRALIKYHRGLEGAPTIPLKNGAL